MNEGVIKFKCEWIQSAPLEAHWIEQIDPWRTQLFKHRLIGMYPDGIGYGNISIRVNKDQFIISGSATGGIPQLTNLHYTKVTEYNLEQNSLTAVGPIIASSESLSHAAVYACNESIGAVMHVHNADLWDTLINKIPTTHAHIEYGTPAMAFDIMRLYNETDIPQKKIMVMAGHPEGIIAFGKNLEEAGSILLRYLSKG
jgi:ribulose-5-phosphate 4-epimerase/fuculose-1-phosphate aldolase